jgi:Tfp pilus assembly protein PilX
MRRQGVRDESGWALLTTILVLGILMTLALPLMTMVDTQQQGSAQERKSEASFNIADAALNASVFILSNNWPAAATSAYPSSCTSASTGATCPNSGMLTQTFQGADYSGRAWTVKVRDDSSSEYYSASAVDALPSWDANGNGKVWVRADGRAAGRSRTVVALVRSSEQSVEFPRRVITAGWFQTTNNGSKVIVDTRGEAAEPAALAVRCTGGPGSACLGYNPSKGQVSPELVETGYAGATAVSSAVLDGWRVRARALGTYYASGCPSSMTGALIFIENGDCGARGNSEEAPGMVVIARGTFNLGGNSEYYGIVYAANLQGSTGAVVSLGGTSAIIGSVAVDGGGGVSAGASGRNIIFAEQSLEEIAASSSSVGVVQGTWREIPSG